MLAARSSAPAALFEALEVGVRRDVRPVDGLVQPDGDVDERDGLEQDAEARARDGGELEGDRLVDAEELEGIAGVPTSIVNHVRFS